MTFSARDFVRATGARLVLGAPAQTFDGISIDTRTLQAGNLFFAIRGPRHDGHDHLVPALAKSAAGLVLRGLEPGLKYDRRRAPLIFQVDDTAQTLQHWAEYLRKQSQ